jgi:hypothetical protein
MKIVKFAVFAVVCSICCPFGVAQVLLPLRTDFHAGIHSGSWTLERSLQLREESQDPMRSCPDPYCVRCSQHLADYGHEYQFVGGPRQRQLWYPGTTKSVALVTQRGYDQHGIPYCLSHQPAAVVSWEYVRTLNHAIGEQINARNAVAIEEAAYDRVVLLTALLSDAQEQLRLTKEAWDQIALKPCGSLCTKPYKQFCVEMKAGQHTAARSGMCAYCLAQSRYRFDQDYVACVEAELASAQRYLACCSVRATEAVRIALLSKGDADKATRFARLQYKPPKYQEVLAAQGVTESSLESVEEEGQ